LDNPGGYEPERLAAYLHAAAQTGSRDVERFKKEWHSADVRQLLSLVNATDLPQGTDAWMMDYGSLLHGVDHPIEHKLDAVNGISQRAGLNTRENALESINNFKTKHPGLTIEVLDPAKGLPVNITITVNLIHLKFQVNESPDRTGYKVVARPNTESTAIRENILQNISENSVLTTLLVWRQVPSYCIHHTNERQENLAAYSDIKSRPCDKCKKVVDNNALLPYVRKPTAPGTDQPLQFLALHRDCV